MTPQELRRQYRAELAHRGAHAGGKTRKRTFSRMVEAVSESHQPGAHIDPLADTAQPQRIARAMILLPGVYEGGKLVVEHAGARLEFGERGRPHWRWAAWLQHCRHRVEPVTTGARIAMDCTITAAENGP